MCVQLTSYSYTYDNNTKQYYEYEDYNDIASYVTIFNIAPANCLSDHTRSDEGGCSDNVNNNGSSGDNDGAVIALAVLLALAIIGLVISIGINIFLAKENKELKKRYVVTNVHLI